MTSESTGAAGKPLVERAKNIITAPKEEWPRIDAERPTIGEIYKGYVIPLAAIPAVATLIGLLVFGVSMLGISYRPSVGFAVASALVQYVMALASIYVLAMIIEALAPNFGGTKDRVKAFQVAAYASTAGWVAGIFGILPALSWLALIGGIYSLYLLYLGLPILMKVPAARAGGYLAATIVAAILLWIVIGAVSGAVVGTLMPAPGPGSISINVPG